MIRRNNGLRNAQFNRSRRITGNRPRRRSQLSLEGSKISLTVTGRLSQITGIGDALKARFCVAEHRARRADGFAVASAAFLLPEVAAALRLSIGRPGA
jgi:hypothetical protein